MFTYRGSDFCFVWNILRVSSFRRREIKALVRNKVFVYGKLRKNFVVVRLSNDKRLIARLTSRFRREPCSEYERLSVDGRASERLEEALLSQKTTRRP